MRHDCWPSFVENGRTFARERRNKSAKLAKGSKTLWSLAGELLPDIRVRFDALLRAVGTRHEHAVLEWVYGAMRPANFSSQVFEACADRTLLTLDGVEWNDWGRPERVEETLRRGGRPLPAARASAPVAAPLGFAEASLGWAREVQRPPSRVGASPRGGGPARPSSASEPLEDVRVAHHADDLRAVEDREVVHALPRQQARGVLHLQPRRYRHDGLGHDFVDPVFREVEALGSRHEALGQDVAPGDDAVGVPAPARLHDEA